jgi:hypothetical protein
MRWTMAPLDPKVLSMLAKTIDPNVYMRWMMSPLDPRALQLMAAPLNPNLYMGFLGASMNPGSYGETWKGFLNPVAGAVPTTAGWPAPAATPWAAPAAGTAPTVNFFDPNAWAQMLPAAPQGGYVLPFAMPTAPVAPAAK